MKKPAGKGRMGIRGLEDRAPLLVFIICLVLTGVSTWGSYRNVKERERLRFRLAIADVQENLLSRIDSYLGVLWAAVGLFQANDLNVSDAQFRKFRLAADWGERNNGLAGLTFVQKVEPENREAFEAKYRDRVEGFRIHPDVSDDDPLYALTHLEPAVEGRERALGYNPYSEATRRRALELSARTGRASITDKVVLRSDELDGDSSPAIILYAPVYHPGAELLPLDGREHLLYGFVGAGFHLNDLVRHLRRGPAANQVGFQITVGHQDEHSLIAETGTPVLDKRPLSETRKVEVANGVWLIHFWALPDFYARTSYFPVLIVVSAGLLLSLSLFSLAIVQSRARRARELSLHYQTERARDLEEQDKAKTRFFSNLNHELRTPLNGILGMSDLLYDTDLNEVQKDYLNSIGSCARALLDLINDVLDLSKVKAGKMELNPAPVEIRTIFEQALQVVRGPAQGKGVDLHFEWDETIPSWVELDAVRLRQVLVNLLGNAVKFTAEGSVTLCAKMLEPERLCFEVADTGIGISTEDVRKLFRPFSQVGSGSAEPEQQGTGLGLHLCKELLALMGGEIEVESEAGKGSTFRGRLPLTELDSNPYETQTIPDASAHLSPSLRILVVDDNPINRRVLALQLEKAGHEVAIAGGGEEAVEQVEAGDFDLVLMDCQMPGVDGLEATRRIRRTREERPFIVALTAYAEDTQREACLEVGMDDFLTKPVEASRLHGAVRKLGARLVGHEH